VQGCYVGEVEGRARVTPLERLETELDPRPDRPYLPWWLGLRPVVEVVGEMAGAPPVG
jgi:hypothetical protein